jgi:raffinose/stachyose/melibiose transport system permease protein
MVVLADLMAIPQEIHEAAKIDGAGGWQTLRLIDLPLCKFSIGTSIIMSITSRISMFEAIQLTSRGGPGNTTMSLSIILVRNITDNNFGMANATAVIMFAMGIGIMLLISRLFKMNEGVY